MIAIYSDSEIIDLEWIPKIDFQDAVEIFHSFKQYSHSTHVKKIAFTAHRLHCTYDKDCDAYKGFEDKIVKLSEISDLVFSLESELHHYHWRIWQLCHRSNVYWLQPGFVNDPAMDQHIIPWADFFKLVVQLYKKLPHKLDLLRPYESKPKFFDALLGSRKPHRQFFFDLTQQHAIQDCLIMTYGGVWKNNDFYAKDYFIWEPGCEPEQPIIGTADCVTYHGISTPLSHVIPIDIYNSTAYSVVAETDHDNTLSFFSEKTAKVLLARRLFVAFSGCNFLHNLRRLGFRTFHGIIDESYDQITNDSERYTQAFAQVLDLCGRNQQQVLDSIRPITEHNYKVLTQTDWTRYATDQVQIKIQGLNGH